MQEVLSLIRHVLTTAGGGLVAAGYLSDQELVTSAGAVATLIGVVWGVVSKRLFTKAS